MKKKMTAAVMALVLAFAMCTTAFAGWEQYESGEWTYTYADGSYAANTWIGNYYIGPDNLMLVNNYTPDGYWVGASGACEPWWGRRTDSSSPYSGGTYDGIYHYQFYLDTYGDGVQHWSVTQSIYGSVTGQYELYPMGPFSYEMMNIYTGESVGYVAVSPDRRIVYVSTGGQTDRCVY
ncbi:MAG: hypothetical protein K6E83_13885 [Clostridium sp.]|nr:hypothetical protein [Clostridium sp.]